jgi:hypothetical protein
MKSTTLSVLRLLGLLTLPSLALAQSMSPVAVSLCDLLKDPKAYDGKQIQIRGKINLEFENFSIYDVDCNTWPGVWLLYGGDVSTPTKSTVNDNHRTPGRNVKVNGIEYDLVKDVKLEEFSKAITANNKRRPIYRVTATLIGTFLSGRSKEESKAKRMPNWPGYGHMGCCYLFIIQQVSAFETKPFEDSGNERWSTIQQPKP